MRTTANRKARHTLEEAIGNLIEKARNFPDIPQGWQIRELLAQAREYGRAFNRVETMRK